MDNLFLQTDNAIIAQLKSIDWRNNPLGAMEQWPESLKTSLGICFNSPLPILVSWGPELIMLYNNAYGALLEGNDKFKAFGMPARECWSLMWDVVGPKLENVMLTGESVLLKDQMSSLKRNGVNEDRYFTISYSPIFDEEEIKGIFSTVNETTDKIRSKLRFKFEQDRFKRFFNQAPVGICILDGPEMIFELVNPSYQQLFPGRSLLGKPLLEALPEIKNSPVHEILLNVYENGEPYEGKELLVPLSRSEGAPLENIYFNFIYHPRWNAQHEIDGILVLAYEVTDYIMARNSVEQLALKIEQQARSFDITLSAIKDFVYTFDTDGRFTYSNKPLLDLLGITLDQIIGKNFHDLPYPTELANTLQTQIAQVIRSGKPVTDETLYTNPEGKTGYYEYIFTPIFDGGGNVVLVAGSTRDISEHKKTEEAMKMKNLELENLNNELVRVNSDMDNFIYTASHDLKAPILNIEGLIMALKKNLTKENLEHPKVSTLLPMIQTSIERFNKTLQDLTDITKLQRVLNDKESKIDLKKIIEDIKLDLSSMLEKSNGQIILDIDSNMKELHFSSKNLRSVLYNLISNSIKYRSPDRDPVIRIAAREEHDAALISVQDNGLGMDLSKKDAAFTMFKRLHNHVEGSGIGLYIVKKIIENAGGRIDVESEIGEGTTFKLFLKKSGIDASNVHSK
jgi:two-component system, sensor histidine kinase